MNNAILRKLEEDEMNQVIGGSCKKMPDYIVKALKKQGKSPFPNCVLMAWMFSQAGCSKPATKPCAYKGPYTSC